jgi:hypothetical protein
MIDEADQSQEIAEATETIDYEQMSQNKVDALLGG